MTQLAAAELDVGALTERLAAALVRDRAFVLGMGVVASTTRPVEMLRNLGARRPLVLARGVGTGPGPAPEDADVRVLDLPTATTISGDIRLEEMLLRNPPPAVTEAVDEFDPAGEARWWIAPHIGVSEVAGRAVIAPRRPEWIALEDKTVNDELFDACAVRRPPSALAAPTYEALTSAAAVVDRGAGTVWSGDAREGMNGGAELVRWVRTEDEACAATALLAASCDKVRVAAFIDGVPCSIHGIVLPDGVAVLRPVELLMLRGADNRFVYGGMASWWDPPAADRDLMRAAARRVGLELARRVDFRGGFSIDGVLGADGWLPTEVNTRFSGGLSMLSRDLTGFPLLLLQLAVVEGVDIGVPAELLERVLLTGADAVRSVSTAAFTRVAPAHGEATVETAEGTLTFGASMIGGLVRVVPARGALRVGEPVAPLIVRALARADAEWGTDFGPCTAAPDVRRAEAEQD